METDSKYYRGYRFSTNTIGVRAHAKGHTIQGRNGATIASLKREIDWHKDRK